MSVKMYRMFLIYLMLCLCLHFASAQSPVTFTDVGASTGTHVFLNPHGSGFFDYNNDGLSDIFVVHNLSTGYIGEKPHALLKNLGNGTFENVTVEARVGGYNASAQGLAAGDYDNDGDMDMAIGMGNWGTLLYRNNNDGTFSNVSDAAGVSQYNRGRCLAFFDYNNDGHVDLLQIGDPSLYLLQNKGDGTFVHKRYPAGLY
ncbi:unnamed protein product, partial [marine sediment metagenome]